MSTHIENGLGRRAQVTGRLTPPGALGQAPRPAYPGSARHDRLLGGDAT
ncbi:hypothetical protein [Streptomyces sp. NBC_00328]|nr:hypothetical protein [Streptomyces sp. NBC_00328]